MNKRQRKKAFKKLSFLKKLMLLDEHITRFQHRVLMDRIKISGDTFTPRSPYSE